MTEMYGDRKETCIRKHPLSVPGEINGIQVMQMILRDFVKEDAPIIAGWIRSEDELYKWSADRFNKYPLSGDDINENYDPQIESGRFHPLTAVDNGGEVVGHFIIRYPRADDDSSVRFGFVIVNPAFRGRGYGREMLRLAIGYVKDNFPVLRIDLSTPTPESEPLT